jgi:hypothetical protein
MFAASIEAKELLMGGLQDRPDQFETHREDPVTVERATLLDHAADLDEAGAALRSGDQVRAATLLAGVRDELHGVLFMHLPDGRSLEEQDLAPLE